MVEAVRPVDTGHMDRGSARPRDDGGSGPMDFGSAEYEARESGEDRSPSTPAPEEGLRARVPDPMPTRVPGGSLDAWEVRRGESVLLEQQEGGRELQGQPERLPTASLQGKSLALSACRPEALSAVVRIRVLWP